MSADATFADPRRTRAARAILKTCRFMAPPGRFDHRVDLDDFHSLLILKKPVNARKNFLFLFWSYLRILDNIFGRGQDSRAQVPVPAFES